MVCGRTCTSSPSSNGENGSNRLNSAPLNSAPLNSAPLNSAGSRHVNLAIHSDGSNPEDSPGMVSRHSGGDNFEEETEEQDEEEEGMDTERNVQESALVVTPGIDRNVQESALVVTPGIDRDDGGRVKITLKGKCFQPRMVLAGLHKIIHSHYNEPWISFNEVSVDGRKLWFDEFKRKYYWDVSLTPAVYAVWKMKVSDHLRNILRKARDSLKQPPWIADDVWTVMKKKFEDKKFKERSEINRKNRASVPSHGTATYTGGSIPVVEHQIKLTGIYKRPPTIEELVQATFQKKSTGEWSGSRVSESVERYKVLLEAYKTANPDIYAAGNPSVISNSEIALWVQAVGGSKKGRVFGLGSHLDDVPPELMGHHSFANQSYSTSADKARDVRMDKFEETILELRNMILSLSSQLSFSNGQQLQVQPSYHHFQTQAPVPPFAQVPPFTQVPARPTFLNDVDIMSYTSLLESNQFGGAPNMGMMFGTTQASQFATLPTQSIVVRSSPFQTSEMAAPSSQPLASLYAPSNMRACRSEGSNGGSRLQQE